MRRPRLKGHRQEPKRSICWRRMIWAGSVKETYRITMYIRQPGQARLMLCFHVSRGHEYANKPPFAHSGVGFIFGRRVYARNLIIMSSYRQPCRGLLSTISPPTRVLLGILNVCPLAYVFVYKTNILKIVLLTVQTWIIRWSPYILDWPS